MTAATTTPKRRPSRRRSTGTIKAVDLFCGAGGFSSGLIHAAEGLGREVDLIAINHWDIAIQTHSANHANVRHMCQSVETINPTELIPGGYLDLLMASPECTHHSLARGGKPMSEQSRATTWCILRWLEKLDVQHVIIENVGEFRSWGPIHPCTCGTDTPEDLKSHKPGHLCLRPILKEKGKYFRNFTRNLRVLGYKLDWRVLNSADYGAATTRKRFFLLASKTGKVLWPEPTHYQPLRKSKKSVALRSQAQLFDDGRLPWRQAREIIDWELQGTSIFDRDKPLAQNTLARIYAGLRKFSGLPFIVPNFGERPGQAPRVHSLEDPLPTVTAQGHQLLCSPLLLVLRNHCGTRDLADPIPTLAANGEHIGLLEPRPFILPHQHGNDTLENVRSIEAPLSAVTGTSADMFLAQPQAQAFGVNMKGESDAFGLGQPAPCITAHASHLYLAEPQAFMLGQQSGAVARSVAEPTPTVAAAGAISLIETKPFLFEMEHNSGTHPHEHRVFDPEEPLRTIAGKGMVGLIEPHLVEYHGSRAGRADGDARTHPLTEPLPVVDTANRFGLSQPFIVSVNHGKDDLRVHNLQDPLATIAGNGTFALIEPQMVEDATDPAKLALRPFLVRFKSSERQLMPVEEPLGAVDTRERYALVEPRIVEAGELEPGAEVIGRIHGKLDVLFRMLQYHELAAAMGFSKTYRFAGSRKDKIRQIGNAVEVNQAKALCLAVLS